MSATGTISASCVPTPRLEYSQDAVLYTIHKRIDKLSLSQSFWKGIQAAEKNQSCCGKVVCKVALTASGLCIVAFSGASFLFGTLALKQGISDYAEISRAPIIGHFSEWTIQSVLSLSMLLNGVTAFSNYGRWIKIQKIFLDFLEKQELSPKQQAEIYNDYLQFLTSQPQPSFFTLPLFPKMPKAIVDSSNKFQTPRLDEELRPIFDEIEAQYNQYDFADQVREGWKWIQSGKSCWKKTMLITFLVAQGIFMTGHVINYALGIYWSGQQALVDYNAGDNPSIGGHPLEWSVETLALMNIVYFQLNEIANVGKAKILVDLFRQKIDDLNSQQSQNTKLKERLHWHLAWQIRRIPQGILFKVPCHLPFLKPKKIENELQDFTKNAPEK